MRPIGASGRGPRRRRRRAPVCGTRTLLGLLGASLAPPTALLAQEDFRSADVDRPIRVEDALPLKFREWEIELGARGVMGEGAGGLLGILELKSGLFRNGQLGIELEGGFESPEAGTATVGGLEAATAHVLYGFSRQTIRLPALAIRVEASTPGAGGLGHEDWRLGAKGIATRSFGRSRVHLNAGYTFATTRDGGGYWLAGVGLDYPLGLFSRALLADIYSELPVSAGRARLWAEIGMRLQVSNWSVLDIGGAIRLDEWERGRPTLELVVGFSRGFGIPGLTRVPPYPDPTIP